MKPNTRDCLKFLHKVKTGLQDRISKPKTMVQLKSDEGDLKTVLEIMDRLKEIEGLGGQKSVIELAKAGAKPLSLF
jgi:hypothetical protein